LLKQYILGCCYSADDLAVFIFACEFLYDRRKTEEIIEEKTTQGRKKV